MGVKRASRQVSAHFPPPLVSGFRLKDGVLQSMPRTPIRGSSLGEGEFCFTATDPTCYTMLHRNTLLKRVSDKCIRSSFDKLKTNGSFRFPQTVHVSDKRTCPSFDTLRTNGSFRFPQTVHVSDKRARPSFDKLKTNGSFRFPQTVHVSDKRARPSFDKLRTNGLTRPVRTDRRTQDELFDTLTTNGPARSPRTMQSCARLYTVCA